MFTKRLFILLNQTWKTYVFFNFWNKAVFNILDLYIYKL